MFLKLKSRPSKIDYLDIQNVRIFRTQSSFKRFTPTNSFRTNSTNKAFGVVKITFFFILRCVIISFKWQKQNIKLLTKQSDLIMVKQNSKPYR